MLLWGLVLRQAVHGLLVVVGRFGLRDVDGEPHPDQAVVQLATCPLGSVEQLPVAVTEAIVVDLGYPGFNLNNRKHEYDEKHQPAIFCHQRLRNKKLGVITVDDIQLVLKFDFVAKV